MRTIKILLLFTITSLLLLSCDKPEFTNLADTDLEFPAPTNLTITATSVTSCELNWEDNSNGEQYFMIDRKKDNEEWIIPYQTVGSNVESLTDTSLIVTSTYQYSVYGFADENTSSSITGEINMIFPTPTNLSIIQTSFTSCELNWDYSGFGDEEGFRIERRLIGGSWSVIAELSISVNSYEDIELTEEETYEYQVYAFNSLCNGNVITETIELRIIVTDIDGNVYQVVQIGSQFWMAENLKVTRYKNGNTIPHLTIDGAWTSTYSGAYCFYHDNSSNIETYGNLYNWYAVDDSRGLAPEGWHVPTDEDIMELELHLGMSQFWVYNTGGRGTNEGSKLAGNAALWFHATLENDPEFGTSGFNFLPGGERNYNYEYYYNMSYRGSFWSSSEIGSYDAWFRYLSSSSTSVYRFSASKCYGFSVRCVMD